MKRHRFDPLSFVFGLTFLVVAAAASVPGLALDGSAVRWVGAALLVLFGVLMLTTSSTRREEDL